MLYNFTWHERICFRGITTLVKWLKPTSWNTEQAVNHYQPSCVDATWKRTHWLLCGMLMIWINILYLSSVMRFHSRSITTAFFTCIPTSPVFTAHWFNVHSFLHEMGQMLQQYLKSLYFTSIRLYKNMLFDLWVTQTFDFWPLKSNQL